MTNKNATISITQNFIENNETYKDYVIDSTNIVEKKTLWYIPFKELNPNSNNFMGGAYNCLIIDKKSTDYLQPGSGLSLENWMYGFELGLRGKRYDLHIKKVLDHRTALDILDKLSLTYVKIEIEGGTEWKIPKNFNRKEIKRRLDKTPCIFKNQSFTFSIDKFRRIREERIFEYKLLKSVNTDSTILGELLES